MPILLPGPDQMFRVRWIHRDPRFHLGVHIGALTVEERNVTVGVWARPGDRNR
jgi:hypothetical protein